MVGVAAGSATSVISSNLGDVDPAINRPDGTDADTFVIRSLDPGMTTATMHRLGGCWCCSRAERPDRSSSRCCPTSLAGPTRLTLLRQDASVRTTRESRASRLVAQRASALRPVAPQFE